MAKKKKRKKSKGKKSRGGKKKSRQDEKPGGRAPTSVDEASVEPDEEDAAAGSDTGEPETDDDRVAAVIDVEEELDDPEARAELIAAAAGLADDLAADEEADEAGEPDGGDGESSSVADDPAVEEGDEQGDEAFEDERAAGDEAVAASGEQALEEKGDAQAVAASGEQAPEEKGDAEAVATSGDEVSEEKGADDAARDAGGSEEEGEDGPLIGRAALNALDEFRKEGVATMPEELVLELGETVPQEERDRLLAAALAHVQMQDAIYRVPTESGTSRRWKGLIAAFVLVATVFVAGLPPAFLVPEGPTALSVEERLRGLRVSLLVQAEQIEAFRVREDRLPEALSEVRTALPGIRYIKSNDRLYQLVAYRPDGEPVVYDSAFPDAAFGDVARSWVTTRNDS